MDEWQKERMTGIGGTDAPVIMLGESWGKTVYDLWLEKTGAVPRPDVDNPDIRRGRRQEPIAAQLYEEISGNKVRRVNRMLRHRLRPFMVANIDREILGLDAVLEIKCPRFMTYRKYQLQGIPDDIQIQGQHYLAVKGKGLVVFAVFCAEIDELMVVPVERDDELIGLIEGKEAEFWRLVEDKKAPEQPSERIELPPIGGELITISTKQWESAVEMLRDARELKSEAEELDRQATEQIQGMMTDMDALVAEGAGARIYWNYQQGRITLDQKRLKTEKPDIYKQYMKVGKPMRPFRPYFLKQ